MDGLIYLPNNEQVQMITMLYLSVYAILFQLSSSYCIPTNICTKNGIYTTNETVLETSNQYICTNDGIKCYASYSNGDCSGDPIYCDDESDSAHFEHITCDNSCDSYIKIRKYEIDDSDTMCLQRSDSDYYELIIPTGCNPDTGDDASFGESNHFSCTDSSYSGVAYSETGCSGYEMMTIMKTNGCDNEDSQYIDIQYCGSCMIKPYIFLSLLVISFLVQT